MSKDELQASLAPSSTRPRTPRCCVSMCTARQDGTVLLEDCPSASRGVWALIASTLGLWWWRRGRALTALVFLHQRVPATNVAPEPVACYRSRRPRALARCPVVNTLGGARRVPRLRHGGGCRVRSSSKAPLMPGTVPLTVQATPSDHTYRATLGSRTRVFALTVGSNSCAMHRLALGTKAPTPTATPTAKLPPGWRGRHLCRQDGLPHQGRRLAPLSASERLGARRLSVSVIGERVGKVAPTRHVLAGNACLARHRS